MKKLFFAFIILLNFGIAYGENNEITILVLQEKREVNKSVFGNNIIAYDPMTYENWVKEYYGYSDYGAGIWDSKWKESVKDVINLAKEAGITILRFPGGCGTHHYNWKETVGNKRKHFLYGIDEFLKTCKEIGTDPVITISYFTGNEQDAADLVEYLNALDDGNHKWAAERTKNGHREPYNVKYFEAGNEVYHGDHRDIKKILPENYARRYLKYYEAMKTVDSSVKIGVVLHTADWNQRVLEIIKDKVDFGIIHTYPTPAWGKKLEQMKPKDIYKESLDIPIFRDEINFQNTLKLLREKSGRDIPLAITEYNGGFVQDKPVPYRHCLGTALINAELLRIFMKPEHNILMANYWQFNNSYWGMIANGFNDNPKDLNKPYYKRPNYYVFEMYHKHFGDILLDIDVKCDSYKVQGHKIPYLSVNASKSSDGKKVYLMVINKNMDEATTSNIDLKDFIPNSQGNAWVLNGPSVDASNEKKHNNVKVAHKRFEIKGNPFEFTFEPHSLTAVEIRAQGTSAQEHKLKSFVEDVEHGAGFGS